MIRYKEKELHRFVLGTIDKMGRTLYIRYKGNAKYDLVDDIEFATKLDDNSVNDFADIARIDLGANIEFAVLPLTITYELINEIGVQE